MFRSLLTNSVRPFLNERSLYSSALRSAQSSLTMPALSPTMTSGAITTWSVIEGQSYTAGEVLLGIETDKAVMDVEAMEDGIMGKILVQNGATGVDVGRVIAILLEEGDSIDSIVLPSSSPVAPSLAPSAVPAATPPPIAATPSPTPATIAASASVEVFHPQSTKPLSPAVARLLAINKIENANQITASGKHGMLTKGDVLRFLNGTNISAVDTSVVETSPIETVEIVSGAAGATPLSSPLPANNEEGASIRRLITLGLSASKSKSTSSKIRAELGFDSILSDYLPAAKRFPPKSVTNKPVRDSYLDL